MRWIMPLLVALALLGAAIAEASAKPRQQICRASFFACTQGKLFKRHAAHKKSHKPRDHERARRAKPRDHERARRAVDTGNALPLTEVLRQVRRRYPGKLLDADLIRRGNSLIYGIKIRGTDNRIRYLNVDARTGRILSARGRRR